MSLEDLVPEDHLLRKIDAAISFEFIYDEIKGMYSEADWGNPGIDPIALFKIVFIQYLFGIRSMRQTIQEIDEDRAAHGKKLLKRDKHDDNDDGSSSVSAQTKTITVSATDPECGLFHKGEHEKQFAYVTGVVCDRHNFVLGYNLVPGNTHDSTMFSE